jgi:hypothetical protein
MRASTDEGVLGAHAVRERWLLSPPTILAARANITRFGLVAPSDAHPAFTAILFSLFWMFFSLFIASAVSTGVIIKIAVLKDLADVIAASPVGYVTFLVTENGKPFTANGFGNWFREACDQADLPQCESQGLRKAGATRAAERGVITKQLMAIFGWSDPKQAETYIKKVDQKRLAKQAVTLPAQDESENEFVAPKLGAAVAPERMA